MEPERTYLQPKGVVLRDEEAIRKPEIAVWCPDVGPQRKGEGRRDKQRDRQKEKQTDTRTDEKTTGQTKKQMNGQLDEWMDLGKYSFVLHHFILFRAAVQKTLFWTRKTDV